MSENEQEAGDAGNTVDMPTQWNMQYNNGTAATPWPYYQPAGSMYVGDVPWQYMLPSPPWAQQYIPVTLTTGASTELQVWPFKTLAELGAFIDERVHAVLEADAREIRESKAFQPTGIVNTPSGMCWACGEYGESGAMMWFDQFDRQSHLVHATAECIRAAESKSESKEHRG